MTSGMSASDCHNYQRFIGTLDDAIVNNRACCSRPTRT